MSVINTVIGTFLVPSAMNGTVEALYYGNKTGNMLIEHCGHPSKKFSDYGSGLHIYLHNILNNILQM